MKIWIVIIRAVGLSVIFSSCCIKTAEAEPKLRLLMGYSVNRTPARKPNLDNEVSNAVRSELGHLTGPDTEQFITIPYEEFEKERRQLSPTDRQVKDELIGVGAAALADIADRLRADIIVHSSYRIKLLKPGRNSIDVWIYFLHISAGETVAYSAASATAKSIDAAIVQAVASALHKCLQQRIVKAVIRSRTKMTVVLSLGIRAGVAAGDQFIVLREVDGRLTRVGQVQIRQVSADASEAEIILDFLQLHEGDVCLRIAEFLFNRIVGGTTILK